MIQNNPKNLSEISFQQLSHQDMDFSKMKHEFVTITLKRVRYAHHCEFLTQCLSHKVVPKGMHINLKINAPGKPSSSFQNRLLGIQLGRQMSRRQTLILLWSTFLALNSQNLRNPCFLKVGIFALDLKAMTKESLLKTPRPSQGV